MILSTEQKLKQHILQEYRSIRDFCIKNDFPYSTINNIFKRGILGSSVSVVIRVCDRLNLDIDKLISGEISEKRLEKDTLSSLEYELVLAYRQNSDMQEAVNKLLGLDKMIEQAKREKLNA